MLRYRNSTLVSVPDTNTEFLSHTNLTLDDILFRTFWWNFTTLITLISQLLVNLHPVEGWIDLSRATFILPASQEWRVIAQKIHRFSINKTSSLPLQVASVWFNLLGARQCTLRLLWKTVLQCYQKKRKQKIFVQIQNKFLVQLLNYAVVCCQLIVNLRSWSEAPSFLFLTNAFFLQNNLSYSLKQIIGDHNI